MIGLQGFAVREPMRHHRFFTFPARFVGKRLVRQGPEAFREYVQTHPQGLAAVAATKPTPQKAA